MPPRHLSAKNITIAAAVSIILIALGIYIYSLQGKGLSNPLADSSATSTPMQNSTSTNSLTPEEQQKIIDDYGLNLKAEIDLAQKRKQAGDYKGAADVLIRAGQTFPGNVVSFNNLGDIYLNFTKEYTKAEQAYLRVIQNDSRQLNAFRQLYEIYTQTTLKNEVSAKGILEQGIAANPKAFDLMVLLAQYYKGKGQNTQARVQYEAAIAAANAAGNTSVAAAIQAELNQLPQ